MKILLVLLTLTFAFSVFGQPALVTTIVPNQIVEREIDLKDTHLYSFSLNAGEFVRFEIRQKNVDPVLIISDKLDNQLHQLYFEKQVGKTFISFVAPEKNEFRLKLKSSGKSQLNGHYRLAMADARPADENDRQRIAAEKILTGNAPNLLNIKHRQKNVSKEKRSERIAELQKLLETWQKLNDSVFEQETWHQIGLSARKSNNLALAQTAFEKVLQSARNLQDLLDEAWALYHLGDLAENRGELEPALKNFQTAHDLTVKSGALVIEEEMLNRLANFYRNRDQFIQARDSLNKMLAICQKLNNEVDAAKAKMSLAIVENDIDPKYEVKPIYEEALQVFEKHEAFYEKANVLRLLGSTAADKSQFAEAEKYLTESLVLLEKYDEPSDEAFTLVGLGLLKLNESKFPEAARFFNRALARLEGEKDSVIKIRAIVGLARVEFSQSNLNGGLSRLQMAVQIADTLKTPREQVEINTLLSALYQGMGQNEKALETALSAKKIADEVKNKHYQAVSLTALGRYYHFQGNYPLAIKCFEESIKLAAETNQRRTTVLGYQTLGALYYDLGNLGLGEFNYLKAIEMLEKIATPGDKMLASLLSAEIYMRQHKFTEAKAELTELSKLIESTKNTFLKGQTNLFLGFIAIKEGNFTEASREFTSALAVSVQSKNVVNIALALRGLGDSLVGLGNLPQAQTVLGQTLGIFRQIGSPTGEADVFQSLMKMEIKKGNRRLAIFYGKQGVALAQSVRGTIKTLDAEVRKNFLLDNENYYRDLASALIEENRLAEAQQILSLFKEEEFYQFTQRSPDSVSPSVNQVDFNGEEAEAAQKYKVLTDKVSAATTKLTELLQKSKKTAEEQAEQQRLQKELESFNAEFAKYPLELIASFSKPAQASEISTVQTTDWQKRLTTIGPDSVLLTTLVTNDKYYVIITTPTAQFARKVEIAKSDLSQKIEYLQALLSKPETIVAGGSEEIYKILVKPLEADLVKLKPKTLLWSLDGALRYVPLAALYDGQKYMVEKFTNVVVTLAQPSNKTERPINEWRALGGGVSIKIRGFDSLPGVETELKSIVRDETSKNLRAETGLFAGKRLLNQAFNRRNLTDALKQRFQLVHFATHFSLNPGSDIYSYLLLGDGSKLTLAEMRTDRSFDLSGVELLTLSACKTAQGKERGDGKEIESFGVIAQKRGAKAVIATLWSIADNATSQLMIEFYRNYKNGNGQISKAEALRQAQLTILKKNKTAQNFSHPAYWASFIVLGE